MLNNHVLNCSMLSLDHQFSNDDYTCNQKFYFANLPAHAIIS